MATLTERKIDHALQFIVSHCGLICQANEVLGIPIEDAICCAVRKASLAAESDPRQLEFRAANITVKDTAHE